MIGVPYPGTLFRIFDLSAQSIINVCFQSKIKDLLPLRPAESVGVSKGQLSESILTLGIVDKSTMEKKKKEKRKIPQLSPSVPCVTQTTMVSRYPSMSKIH